MQKNKAEKDKRKALKKSFKAREMEQVLASLPIPLNTLKELFNWLGFELKNEDCDNTFKHTQVFITQNNLSEETLLKWLGNQGGFCDCEVLANVSEHFED